MIDACTDIYQPFRMALVWPVIVGCVAFFAVRFVAVLAFVFWVTMAVATTSTTSMFIDAMFAYAMFGEIVTQRGDCT